MTAIVRATELALPRRLERISIDLHAGQLVGLIGPNGSGKTSLLHAFAGIPPAVGAVTIDGTDPRGLHPFRRQRLLSFLAATRDTAWPLPARDIIQLGLPPGSDWQGVAECLELESLLDRRMDRLSTGERSRVMIARALAPDAALLLLDEPIANLDPYWQMLVLRILRDRAAQRGAAILVAIHDLQAALQWSDRVLVMENRAVVADGNPNAVLASGVIEKVFRVSVAASPSQFIVTAGPQSSP